jgi:hypothetical protein
LSFALAFLFNCLLAVAPPPQGFKLKWLQHLLQPPNSRVKTATPALASVRALPIAGAENEGLCWAHHRNTTRLSISTFLILVGCGNVMLKVYTFTAGGKRGMCSAIGRASTVAPCGSAAVLVGIVFAMYVFTFQTVSSAPSPPLRPRLSVYAPNLPIEGTSTLAS